MLEQTYFFKLDGEPIFCTRYGNGHINETYLLVDSTAREYILQKINKNVFHKPEQLMANIVAVTKHLRKTTPTPREVLTIVRTIDDKDWHVDKNGDYWRIYEFVSDSFYLDLPKSAKDIKESGTAFGRFQRKLADFPADTLWETIPLFHDTPNRVKTFKQVLKADRCGRAKEVQREIEFVLALEGYASMLTDLQTKGQLPLRVTHNDTKLNNVLFDRYTNKGLCVIDLDTVMPGFSVNDFGDSIRFGASTAAEDEQNLSRVSISLEMFEAYACGFLSECGSSLTKCEIENLCSGAKMMTLECGIRFLTDYLDGDLYFRTSREAHNLDRARTQFKLIEEMERNWDKMQRIIKNVAT